METTVAAHNDTLDHKRSKKISRDMIQQIAVDLFHEKGVEETSVNDIVKAAGIAKGTFYLYFENKDDLINSVFDTYREAFIKAVVLSNKENPKIIFFAPSILDFFSENSLFLTELRKDLYQNKNYSYTKKTISAFSQVILNYLNLNENYPISQLDTYSHMIIGMLLEICYKLVIEKTIADKNEAIIMMQDFLKRFFSCE